jgi:cyclopropane fatty-acyl-phospholipid synthase-like methyltransferase
MKSFTAADVIDYYHHTEVHYRMFWQLDRAMGLHYGLWDETTPDLAAAIIRVNARLADLGEIAPSARVLDAGCGIGGSSLYLAQTRQCRCTGITLSDRQVAQAQQLAQQRGLADHCDFAVMDYAETSFADDEFDVVWAIESLGSAPDKARFFAEMRRVLKPGGCLLIADTFKPTPYDIADEPQMQTMLHGWAISDIQAVEELRSMGQAHGWPQMTVDDVSAGIQRSVQRIYYAALLGKFGTWAYNLFRQATPFSKVHYQTGLAQKKAYDAGKWGYYLVKMS